jgi:SAM-dependent methyltransferase
VIASELSAFDHRLSYEGETGRDRWEVRIVNAWVRATVPPLLASVAPGPVIDAGCGEQPFRALVEAHARWYVGMDVVQNAGGSVAVLSDLESVPAAGACYPLVLCTEVLEHVADIDRSFAGLRRLTAPGGCVVLTVPFVYPVHMEPFDFRRLTEYGIAQLADAHGFDVMSCERLGRTTDGLATLLEDASVLPATPAAYDRAKARLLRVAKSWLVRMLDSPWLSDHVTINSHYYLSNGAVLRAR